LLDYRSGALGRVSLETPSSREFLLANYVPPVLLGLGKSVDTGMLEDALGSELENLLGNQPDQQS